MSTNYECICGSKINVTSGFGGPFRVDILYESPEAGPMRQAKREADRQKREVEDRAQREQDIGEAIGMGLVFLLFVGFFVFLHLTRQGG